MDEAELKAIEECHAKSTQRKWTVYEGETFEGERFCGIDGWTDEEKEFLCLSLKREDADFVVAAHNSHIPLLIAEVRRLQAELAKYQQPLSKRDELIGNLRKLLDEAAKEKPHA